jgi:hypothetical protein
MSSGNEYRFKIDVFTPETLPMARLAEYMADYAALLGEILSVHHSKMETSSAVQVCIVDEPAVQKVRNRLASLRDGTAPNDVMKAYSNIDEKLACDNAVGEISGGEFTGSNIIKFLGRNRPKPIDYGVVKEAGELDGVVHAVGGKDDTVPVLLIGIEGEVYRCTSTREMSMELIKHYLKSPIRVSGVGKWRRTPEGVWDMEEFKIHSFEVLDDTPLEAVVAQLRSIEGSDWKSFDVNFWRRDDWETH